MDSLRPARLFVDRISSKHQHSNILNMGVVVETVSPGDGETFPQKGIKLTGMDVYWSF